MAEYAVRLANGADTAPRMRMADALGLTPGDGPLAARNGVRPGTGGVVTVVDGAMQVQVSPFICWVAGGSSTTQGGYPFVLDAAKALTIADGDALLARVDTIAVVIHDDTFDGSGDTSATVEVLQGIAGAGAPALPATCIPLYDVNVPAGASAGTGGLSPSDLGSDRRPWTVGMGGILPVSGSTERDALAELYAGMAVYRADTDRLQVWTGATWDTYAPEVTGSTTMAADGAYTGTFTAYKLPNGLILLTGWANRANGNNSTLHNVVSGGVPVGYRPANTEWQSAPIWDPTANTGGEYRYRIGTDGSFQIQENKAPGGTDMRLNIVYAAA